ncbi:sugar porter family MFS transporter [Gleimia hominis]|uniref:sugar porter family MFS transporter n=1 Tax=Gleimia hominis TaxID=595468 RepID=UPI00268B3727
MRRTRNMSTLNMGMIYFFGSLGGLLFGYDTGVISGAILFIQDQLNLAEWGQGWVVSSVLLGAVIASLFIGPLSDRLGRRKLILIASVVFFVGAIGSGVAPGFFSLVASRIVLGLGVGIASSLIPTYLSELSPVDKRGSLTGLFQLMVMSGILLAYISNYALAGFFHGWRWMVGLAAVPAAVLLIGALLLPESPRFLVRHGDEQKAKVILAAMYKTHPNEVEAQLEDIRRQAEAEDGGWAELFGPEVRPALIAAIGLAIFQQVMGCNTVLYYAPTIFTDVGFGISAALIAHIGIGVFNVIVTAIGIKVMDHVDRKTMLIVGAIGMAVSLFIMSFSMRFSAGHMTAAWICALALTVYIAFFSATWGPVMWTMIGEMFPLNIRGLGNSMGSTINWTANAVVSLTFPPLLNFFGTGSLFVGYGVLCVAAIWFVKVKCFETRNRSLEEIEDGLRAAHARKIALKK